MRTNEEILDALGDVMRLERETIEQLGQGDPEYFTEARALLLKGLRNWEDDHKIPVCLHCGSPRMEWLDEQGSWCCQDCGTIDDDAGEGWRAA